MLLRSQARTSPGSATLRLAPLLALTLTLHGSPRTAHGQASELYADAKSVIKSIITTEAARSAALTIACGAGHEKCEKATSPGCIAFEFGTDANSQKQSYRLNALSYYPASLKALYNEQYGTLGHEIENETLEAATLLFHRGLTEAEKALSNDVKIETHVRTLGDAGHEDAQLARFNGFEATDVPGVATPDEVKAAASEARSIYGVCKGQIASKVFTTTATMALPDSIDKRCPAGTKGDNIACQAALAFRAAAREQQDAARQHAERVLALLLQEHLSLQLPAEKVTPDAILAALRGALRDQTLKFEDHLAAALGVPVGNLSAVKTQLLPIGQKWIQATNGGSQSLNIVTLVELLSSTADELVDACIANDPASSVCMKARAVQRAAARGGAFWPVVEAASRRDYIELAKRSLDAMFDLIDPVDECSDNAFCRSSVYRRFFGTLITYALVEGTTPSELTREAFRSAATELVRAESSLGYEQRIGWNVFKPDLALRTSWSSGYRNQDKSSQRNVASVPFISFRRAVWYTDRLYVGLHFSVFDLLGPLAEIALRDNAATYANGGLLWANFLAPRLDVAVGLPWFSSHLTADVGISARAAVPYPTNAERTTYEYRAIWESDGKVGSEFDFIDALEIGAAIKYVF